MYGEIVPADGRTLKILSDETWKVSDTPVDGWMTAAFDDTRWPGAVKKPFPYTITKPDFSRSMKS